LTILWKKVIVIESKQKEDNEMKKSKRTSAKNNTVTQIMNPVPAVKAEPTEDMVLQFGENEVSITAVSDKVRQSYKEGGNTGEMKDIKIYIKPEDNKAYYVVNGEVEGSVELV